MERFDAEARAGDSARALRGLHFERWLIGHASEIDSTPGISVQELREGTARFGPPLAKQASVVFRDWLTQVGFQSLI